MGQEAVSRRTHTNKYLLFQCRLEVWTLNVTLEHINWASKLSPNQAAETSWKILEWNILGCNTAGWNIPILYRKYIDSFRVHFAASYVTSLGWSGCFHHPSGLFTKNPFGGEDSAADFFAIMLICRGVRKLMDFTILGILAKYSFQKPLKRGDVKIVRVFPTKWHTWRQFCPYLRFPD